MNVSDIYKTTKKYLILVNKISNGVKYIFIYIIMNSTDKCYITKTSNLDKYSKKYIIKELNNFELYQKSPFNINCNTLLDIACGTGVFSIELAKFFTITGEDLSPEGINRAKIENKHENIQYITGDCIENTSKHDIVFCRGPSFFIANNIYSDTFQKYLNHLMKRCNKLFMFGQYNKKQKKAPYEHHNEVDINNVFSKYGKILMNRMVEHHLYVVVLKH